MGDFYKDSYKIRKYELFSLSVCNVGHQKCDPNHHWGPGVKDHYLIHHIVTGKGYYHCNGKLYTLKTGDSFLIYPNHEVWYYADKIYRKRCTFHTEGHTVHTILSGDLQ